MNKLLATEIVDLLSWDTLATTRRNKRSLESQSQRVVVDFNCFYVAMLAHLAFGFSTRQTELVPLFSHLLHSLQKLLLHYFELFYLCADQES
jgi:hypothetical protein